MSFDFSPLALLNLVFYLLIVLFSLSVHESAHAWTAWRLGDPTARMLGRVTLNPIKHVDPVGTLLLPVLLSLAGGPVFGWAKPVPVIRRNFKHLRRDEALVAAAGPASNLILAAAVSVALVALRLVLGPAVLETQLRETHSAVWAVFQMGVVNLQLAAFNLIPVPPLDGSWIFGALLPRAVAGFYEQVRGLGPLLLVLVFMTGVSSWVLGPILNVLILLFYALPLGLFG